AWNKRAREAGIDPEHLHQLADDILEHDAEHVMRRKFLLRDARETMKRDGYNPKFLTARLRSGDIENEVPHFDELVDSMKRRYPDAFNGHGDAEGRMLDLLTEGNPEPMSRDEAYQTALEHLEEHGAGGSQVSSEPLWDDEEPEPLPFARNHQTTTTSHEEIM